MSALEVYTSSLLEVYTSSLDARRTAAEAAGVEGVAMLELIADYKITSKQEYAECGELLRDVKGQIKLIDEERKISVTPLNDEVKRVNDWFRPALESRKKFADHITKLMGAYVLKQQEEERRLLAAAATAAQAVLATDPEAGKPDAGGVGALTQAAAAAAAPKVQGVSERAVFTFEVVDPSALERRFLKPDLEAIGEWVKAHGLENVPAGVKVQKDVRFTVRS